MTPTGKKLDNRLSGILYEIWDTIRAFAGFFYWPLIPKPTITTRKFEEIG